MNQLFLVSGHSGFLIFKHNEKKVKVKSCPTLCDPMDCSLPDFSVHGIFQARILEWVAVSFFRGSSWPRDWTWVSCIVGKRFTVWATKKVRKQHIYKTNFLYFWVLFQTELKKNFFNALIQVKILSQNYEVLVAQLCQSLCNPVDWGSPGSSVCGTLQARMLEWIAISFSRRSSQPRDRTLVSCIAGRLYCVSQQGKYRTKMNFNSWQKQSHYSLVWPFETCKSFHFRNCWIL